MYLYDWLKMLPLEKCKMPRGIILEFAFKKNRDLVVLKDQKTLLPEMVHTFAPSTAVS